jgi:hypothetical protein
MVTDVSGLGATRQVTVATGTGQGTLRLDVLDDGTIVGAGDGLDGPFTSGEVYEVGGVIFLDGFSYPIASRWSAVHP